MLADIKKLSSDEFEGREPGSKGEELTVAYLTEQFKAAQPRAGQSGRHLDPEGAAGRHHARSFTPLVVKRGGKATSFKHHEEVVAFSQHVTDEVDHRELRAGVRRLRRAGARSIKWDDFKGIDVKGKTIIVLVNDPPVRRRRASSTKMFGGKAMTYYGRWTYKYEKAAELGAAGVFIVHETGPAGYPFTVVQGIGGERFNLVTPDKNMGRAASRAGCRSRPPRRCSRWPARTIRS